MRYFIFIASFLLLLTCERKGVKASNEPECSDPFPAPDGNGIQYLCNGKLITVGLRGEPGKDGRNGSPGSVGPRGEKGEKGDPGSGSGHAIEKVSTCNFNVGTPTTTRTITLKILLYSDDFIELSGTLNVQNTGQISSNSAIFEPPQSNMALDVGTFVIRLDNTSNAKVVERSSGFSGDFSCPH